MKKSKKKTSVDEQFFEIVNWKKAQPRMKAGSNDWLKLYTSLLEHDGFCGMDDSSRMLIIALWLYAARKGKHIFPADPKWLSRKIPMLNSTPDLGPLLEATDYYGNPTPFIRYCKPPKVRKGKKQKSQAKTEESRTEESRTDESRVEEKEKTKPLRVSGETEEERKERISTAPTQQIEALEPEKPVNPMESEAGSAKRHIMLKPTRSAFRRSNPKSIGIVLNEWLLDHWQDPDAESFGWEIVRALGYSDDLNNLNSRSEWGAFAKWWTKVKKSAPVMVLDELRAKAIDKANYLRTKGRKSANNRSAVWFHIMNGELLCRGITITQSTRASPG